MDYLTLLLEVQAVLNCFNSAKKYVVNHPEEFLFDPRRQFTRTSDDDPLSFENTFMVPYKTDDKSLEVFGENGTELHKEFLEQDYCRKRQFIQAAAYIYVFNFTNRAVKRFYKFHQKSILGVDGSDQAVYGTPCTKKQIQLLKQFDRLQASILEQAASKDMNVRDLYDDCSQLTALLQLQQVETGPLEEKMENILNLEKVEDKDLKELQLILQNLVNKAKQKQDPFLIVYKNGTTRHAIHANVLYDVLDHIFLDFVLQPGASLNEDAALLELLRNLKGDPADFIITADRGYESWMTFYLLAAMGFFYVIRIKDASESKTFLQELGLHPDGELDIKVNVRLLPDGRKAIHKRNGYQGLLKTISRSERYDAFSDKEFLDMTVRVVRFKVVSAEGKESYQTVVTNLFQDASSGPDSFSLEDIKEVYRLRWQVEESLKALKVQMDIDKIHGRKMETITQEIYAKATVYNIASISRMYIEETHRLGIFSTAVPADPEQFIPAGLLEYKGPMDSAEQSECEAPDDFRDNQPETENPVVPESALSNESGDGSALEILWTMNLIGKEAAVEGYEKPMAIPGVKTIEVTISPDDLIPKDGCRYAHKLSYTVLLGIVKKEIGLDCGCSADRIVRRSLHHKTGIKPGRPDTRTVSKGRRESKARGEFCHSEGKIVFGLSA